MVRLRNELKELQMKDQVKKILDQIKQESFVKGYQATDEEAMGLLLSKYFQWDGVKIMQASANALEDANFHSECAQIVEMIERIK